MGKTIGHKEAAVGLDLKGIFETIDRMDARGFASYFTQDGLFTFGNAPTVKGRDEITTAVEGFFSSIKGLEHRVIETWRDQGSEIVEVDVTYTRHDDALVDLKAACIFRVENDLISDYRIYMDINPLYAEAESPGV